MNMFLGMNKTYMSGFVLNHAVDQDDDWDTPATGSEHTHTHTRASREAAGRR